MTKKKDRASYFNIPLIGNASEIILKLLYKKRDGRASEIEKLLYDSIIIKLHYKISSLVFLILFLSVSCSWYNDSFLACASHYDAETLNKEPHLLNICLSYSFSVEVKKTEEEKKFILFYKWIPFSLLMVAALNFLILRGAKQKLLFIEDDNNFLTFIDHFYSPLSKNNNSNRFRASDVKLRVLSFTTEEKEKKKIKKNEGNTRSVMRRQVDIDKIEEEEKEGRKQHELSYISSSEEESLFVNKKYCNGCVQTFLINWNGYSHLFYNYLIFVILCLCLNVIIFIFLNFCLQGIFWNYGFETFPYIKRVRKFDDPMSKAFPPFVKCVMFENSFLVTNGAVEEYGCHFTLMELYEKIFLFAWFWLIFLFCTTFGYLMFIIPTTWIIPQIRNWILARKFKSKKLITEERNSALAHLLDLTNVGETLVLNCMLELFGKRNAHFEKFCDLLINPKIISILKTIRHPVDKMLLFENDEFKTTSFIFNDV
nr:MAG: hypothetical protein [Porcellio scaber clopovirus]